MGYKKWCFAFECVPISPTFSLSIVFLVANTSGQIPYFPYIGLANWNKAVQRLSFPPWVWLQRAAVRIQSTATTLHRLNGKNSEASVTVSYLPCVWTDRTCRPDEVGTVLSVSAVTEAEVLILWVICRLVVGAADKKRNVLLTAQSVTASTSINAIRRTTIKENKLILWSGESRCTVVFTHAWRVHKMNSSVLFLKCVTHVGYGYTMKKACEVMC